MVQRRSLQPLSISLPLGLPFLGLPGPSITGQLPLSVSSQIPLPFTPPLPKVATASVPESVAPGDMFKVNLEVYNLLLLGISDLSGAVEVGGVEREFSQEPLAPFPFTTSLSLDAVAPMVTGSHDTAVRLDWFGQSVEISAGRLVVTVTAPPSPSPPAPPPGGVEVPAPTLPAPTSPPTPGGVGVPAPPPSGGTVPLPFTPPPARIKPLPSAKIELVGVRPSVNLPRLNVPFDIILSLRNTGNAPGTISVEVSVLLGGDTPVFTTRRLIGMPVTRSTVLERVPFIPKSPGGHTIIARAGGIMQRNLFVVQSTSAPEPPPVTILPAPTSPAPTSPAPTSPAPTSPAPLTPPPSADIQQAAQELPKVNALLQRARGDLGALLSKVGRIEQVIGTQPLAQVGEKREARIFPLPSFEGTIRGLRATPEGWEYLVEAPNGATVWIPESGIGEKTGFDKASPIMIPGAIDATQAVRGLRNLADIMDQVDTTLDLTSQSLPDSSGLNIVKLAQIAQKASAADAPVFDVVAKTRRLIVPPGISETRAVELGQDLLKEITPDVALGGALQLPPGLVDDLRAIPAGQRVPPQLKQQVLALLDEDLRGKVEDLGAEDLIVDLIRQQLPSVPSLLGIRFPGMGKLKIIASRAFKSAILLRPVLPPP